MPPVGICGPTVFQLKRNRYESIAIPEVVQKGLLRGRDTYSVLRPLLTAERAEIESGVAAGKNV